MRSKVKPAAQTIDLSWPSALRQNPYKSAADPLMKLAKRHFSAAWYVLTVVLPVILRTGRRPVIFSRFAGMGDIICTFPAAVELKKRHPGATFIYNCAASFACLPVMGNITSHITTQPHIGLVGYWYRALLAGYYNFNSDDDDPAAGHQEFCVTSFARRQGVEVRAEHPYLQADRTVLAGVKARLGKIAAGPLILIHAGPTWPVKQWPVDSWTALVRELKARGLENIFQLGAGLKDYSQLGATESGVVAGVVSLAGKLSLEESLALIAQADLLVGIDSGLLHAAAAFRIPAVGIWGATSPKFLFSPSEAREFVVSTVDCQGCHHRVPRLHWTTGCPHDIRCLKEISVADVLRACLENLPPEIKS
jgi:ADP-heptose:LPS heptosyltransferase